MAEIKQLQLNHGHGIASISCLNEIESIQGYEQLLPIKVKDLPKFTIIENVTINAYQQRDDYNGNTFRLSAPSIKTSWGQANYDLTSIVTSDLVQDIAAVNFYYNELKGGLYYNVTSYDRPTYDFYSKYLGRAGFFFNPASPDFLQELKYTGTIEPDGDSLCELPDIDLEIFLEHVRYFVNEGWENLL